MDKEPRRINTDEASKLTGYSVYTIQRWCREGVLDAIWVKEDKHGRQIWMMDKQSVCEFAANEGLHSANFVIYCPYCEKFFPAENDVCPACGRRDNSFEPVWDGKGGDSDERR